MISVYGSTGFIGSRYLKMYSDSAIPIARSEDAPQSKDILYFISTTHNYHIFDEPHRDIETNLNKLISVLEASRKSYSKSITFNFISSWFVYGKNQEIPFREDFSKCNPAGFYSITKYCAEQLLISFCQTYDIKYRILRLSNVLGVGDKKISKKKNALQFLIKEIVNNRDVHLYYGGEVLRDYMGLGDICRGIKLCIDESSTNEIINIGSGTPYRFLDLINMAIKYSDSKSKIINIESTNFHDIVQVRHSYLDTSKLLSYGFERKDSIEDTIKELVDFYKKESESA